MKSYDKIIIGGGFFGLWSALYAGQKGYSCCLLEKHDKPFYCASFVNQARVHMGYHYPRSISTATKSMEYFDRFINDYSFCINDSFEQIYAISSNFSWTSARQFIKFCEDSGLYYRQVNEEAYFNKGTCDGAFAVKEYSFDAQILCDWLIEEIHKLDNVSLVFDAEVTEMENNGKNMILTANGAKYASDFVLNTTYASINHIHKMLGFEPFPIKHELCEVILCEASDSLANVGLTVMDGPFFSLMPFGKSGMHSLTSVSFTPHQSSTKEQQNWDNHSKHQSAYPYMAQIARKYLKVEHTFEYVKSLFTTKTVLSASEIDDRRPTVIRQMSKKPNFYSVLSGKINTVYDLESILA